MLVRPQPMPPGPSASSMRKTQSALRGLVLVVGLATICILDAH
jgi:hypothetical protein